MRCIWPLSASLLLLSSCITIFPPSNAIPPNSSASDTTPAAALPQGTVLSAKFTSDNKLPLLANQRVCPGAAQGDSMQVVFDRELDVKTVDAGDFAVVTRAGVAGKMVCVTFMPAIDAGEQRTVVLVGEFGNAQTDPPQTLTITGNLLSRDGQLNYKGATITITPITEGPKIAAAELARLSDVQPRKGSWAAGSGCPATTRQAVRVIWTGGIRMRDGDEPGATEARLYKVELQDGTTISPSAIADLDDGDNNHVLCFDNEVRPKRVTLPAEVFSDANRNRNPFTTALVP